MANRAPLGHIGFAVGMNLDGTWLGGITLQVAESLQRGEM
jgi:hypothetical protein